MIKKILINTLIVIAAAAFGVGLGHIASLPFQPMIQAQRELVEEYKELNAMYEEELKRIKER